MHFEAEYLVNGFLNQIIILTISESFQKAYLMISHGMG